MSPLKAAKRLSIISAFLHNNASAVSNKNNLVLLENRSDLYNAGNVPLGYIIIFISPCLLDKVQCAWIASLLNSKNCS